MVGQLDVVAVGNAIVDVIAPADDAFLTAHGMTKGAMMLIDEARSQELYAAMGAAVISSGGSAANTIAGIASLGGKTGFIGKVRADDLGRAFRHDITATGAVFPTPSSIAGPSTATCLVLVTPDSQRTLNTYLGACVNLGPGDLDAELIRNAQVTYLEGYLYDAPSAQRAFHDAAELAHAAGRKVALTLSDPFCVDRHRAAFQRLVDHHVDLLFANQAEIAGLLETDRLEEIVARVRRMTELAVITRGPAGSLVVSGDGVVEVAAAPVERVVDTTGAGDLYAAGFLFAYTRQRPLAECGRLGSRTAAEVLQHFGARPQTDLRLLASG
jgi:sugar/nucleoside kinase (ribokinase family)